MLNDQLLKRHRRGVLFVRCLVLGLCGVLLAVLHQGAAVACDTPVYRYAMYNWAPAPYTVFHFVREVTPDMDRGVQDAIRELVAESTAQVNLEFARIVIDDAIGDGSLPPAVVERLEQVADGTESVYALVSPHGQVLWFGKLEPDGIGILTDSPTRIELLEQLDGGAAGALVLVDGPDEAANDAAEMQIREAIALAADGKIAPVGIPGSGEDKAAEAFSVGYVRVARDDPAERWLISMLCSIESDLAGIEQPMVFAVYGRGRAMEPWVGKGIRAEGLAEDIAYVTGACSCEVKDQSRGVDLLTRWDWDHAAIALAEQIGEETGNEKLLSSGELLSAVIIGSGGGDAVETSSDGSSEPMVSASVALVGEQGAGDIAIESEPDTSGQEGELSAAEIEIEGSGARSQGNSRMRWLGWMMIVSVVALAIGTFVVARRRSPAVAVTPGANR